MISDGVRGALDVFRRPCRDVCSVISRAEKNKTSDLLSRTPVNVGAVIDLKLLTGPLAPSLSLFSVGNDKHTSLKVTEHGAAQHFTAEN